MLLSTFYLKRLLRFSSPEDYEAVTGQRVPIFDPAKPPKYWRDVAPMDQGEPEATYTVLATTRTGAPARHPQTGRPYLRTVSMWAEEAAAVNLPTGKANAPGENVPPVQVPLEKLSDAQYLDWAGAGDSLAERVALIVVRDRREELLQPATWRLREQTLLEKIAEKLGVRV